MLAALQGNFSGRSSILPMNIFSLELNTIAVYYISMASSFASMFSPLDIAQIGNFCAFVLELNLVLVEL